MVYIYSKENQRPNKTSLFFALNYIVNLRNILKYKNLFFRVNRIQSNLVHCQSLRTVMHVDNF